METAYEIESFWLPILSISTPGGLYLFSQF